MDGFQPSIAPESPSILPLPDQNEPVVPLRIAETGGEATGRSSMTVMESHGKVYRIEFWTDQDWRAIPPAERPPASKAHGGEGWFLISHT